MPKLVAQVVSVPECQEREKETINCDGSSSSSLF